jgi:hypothetical protein
MSRSTFIAMAVAVSLAMPGCGGDEDQAATTQRATPRSTPTQDARLASAAEELDTYLRARTKNLRGYGYKRGQVISLVEPVDGRLKVFTFLNRDVHANRKPAQKVCDLIKQSGVPEAKGALLVDLGDALWQRC